MKKYIVELSETANQDLNNIISYLRYTLSGDIIADKYKILFKQALIDLEDVAGSMPVLSEELTGHKDICCKNRSCIYGLGKIFKR